MTTLYFAICGDRFEPDDDHVRVAAEYVRMQDRNDSEEYVSHPECWQRLLEGWMEPVWPGYLTVQSRQKSFGGDALSVGIDGQNCRNCPGKLRETSAENNHEQ